MIFGISETETKRTLRNREVSVRRGQTVFQNLFSLLLFVLHIVLTCIRNESANK